MNALHYLHELAPHAPGWALIRVNFDPIQEIGPKVGGWSLFCETMVQAVCEMEQVL